MFRLEEKTVIHVPHNYRFGVDDRALGVATACEPSALSMARTAFKIAFSFEKETPILIVSSRCTVHTKAVASVISST
jgi:hypothetical protein